MVLSRPTLEFRLTPDGAVDPIGGRTVDTKLPGTGAPGEALRLVEAGRADAGDPREFRGMATTLTLPFVGTDPAMMLGQRAPASCATRRAYGDGLTSLLFSVPR